MRDILFKLIALCLCYLFATATSAYCVVIHVKNGGDDGADGSTWGSAKLTISSAINDAQAGDEVWVAAGTYPEHINLKPGVSLYGGFKGNETTREARDWTTNVSMLDGTSNGYVIRATTGVGNDTVVDGFTITNGRYSTGSGIMCYRGSPTISHNIITNNGAAYSTTKGGGIYCNMSSPIITNNIISNNQAGYGAGIYCELSNAVVTGNTIVSNRSYDWYSGGIYNNGQGLIITNNIVAFNSSGIYTSTNTTAPFKCNNVYGNGRNYSGAVAHIVDDISVDPLFSDQANGDYRLTSQSLCINAGYNSASGLALVDMDGRPRISDGTVDIGAYEFAVATAAVVTIADAKVSSDGTSVNLTGVVTGAFDDFFYIETDNRTCGLRVNMPNHTITANKIVEVSGEMSTTINGERCLVASAASPGDSASVAPLAVGSCKNIGGRAFIDPNTGFGQQGVINGVGLSTIGLLTRICGKVSGVEQSETPSWFMISDGSGAEVKVVVPAWVVIDENWQHVSVTGISSCEYSGDDLVRVILLRTQEDIVAW